MGALTVSDVVYWFIAGLVSVVMIWLAAGGTKIRWNQLGRIEWYTLIGLAIAALLAGWIGWIIIALIAWVSSSSLRHGSSLQDKEHES